MKRKRLKNGDQKGTKAPWSPATIGIRVAGFSRKPTFLGAFRVSRCLAPVIFSNSDFWDMISVDLRQHHRSTVEIIRLSSDAPKSPTDQPRKHTFCPTDREIEWTDVVGPLVSTNVWNCIPSDIKQHADPLMIIARRIPKGTARPATFQATWQPINAVN